MGENDGTDAFDVRLQVLQRRGASATDERAAIAVYERMRTARAICQALLPAGFGEASAVALALELGCEAQRSQGSTKRA